MPYPDNPEIDAFTYFHGEMSGHVLDFLYQVFKTAHGRCRRDRRLYKALSSSNSVDLEYVETLLKTSLKKTKTYIDSPTKKTMIETVKEAKIEDEESKID